MNDELQNHEGTGSMLTDIDVLMAVDALRKPYRLDGYGVSIHLFRALLLKRPGAITQVLNKISCEKRQMETIEICGHASGQKRSPVTAKAVRTILPLPCVL